MNDDLSVVDEFVLDVLMPHTKHVIPSNELYDLFEKYCGHVEVPVSYTPITFGRAISERLHKTRRNGKTYYYCEVNPRVVT